jgi:hypothetical protein
MLEKITIGRVEEPGPATKLAITRSSNERAKAKNHPERRAGKIRGRIIAVKTYRVYAAHTDEDRGQEDYLMDHSSLIYLMDKNGQYVANFNHNTSPDEMVKRVKLLLEMGK